MTAHTPAFLATLAACTLVVVAIRRWWAFVLPAAVPFAVVAAGLSDWFYQRVPEDVQAGVALGGLAATVLAGATTAVLLATRRLAQGRRPKTP